MTRAQDEREVVLTAIAKVSEWIGFSAGCIKDGRPWDDEATTLRDEAKAALAVLGAAAIRALATSDAATPQESQDNSHSAPPAP